MKWIFYHITCMLTIVFVACGPDSSLTDIAEPRRTLGTAQQSIINAHPNFTYAQNPEVTPDLLTQLDKLDSRIGKAVESLSPNDLVILMRSDEDFDHFLTELYADPDVAATLSKIERSLTSIDRGRGDIPAFFKIHMDKLYDAKSSHSQSLEATPCFDTYQSKMNQVGVEYMECVLSSGIITLGVGCAVIYSAKAQILRTSFENCVRYSIEF